MARKSTLETYAPLAPAPQQLRFSHRRRTVRRPVAPPPPPPAPPKRQSSLTHIGWIDTPPPTNCSGGSNENVIIISSDAEDEYDAPPRSRSRTKSNRRGKNRLLLEKTDSQPTFTQAIRSVPVKRAKRERDVDGDGFEIWRDSQEDEEDGTPVMERIAKRRKMPGEVEVTDLVALCDGAAGRGDESEGGTTPRGASPEIAETSQIQALHDSDEEEAEAVVEQNVATPRTATHVTPRKTTTSTRFGGKEIPSSQSPASSIQLSTSRSHRFINAEADRSPLKQWDGNARFSPLKMKQILRKQQQAGDESQAVARKMLMLMETQVGMGETNESGGARLKGLAGEREGGSGFERRTAAALGKRRKAGLLRVDTVPDSTDSDHEDEVVEVEGVVEEGGRHTSPSVLKGGVMTTTEERQDENKDKDDGRADELDAMTVMQPPLARPRLLKRIATVQESQLADLDADALDSEEGGVKGGDGPIDEEATMPPPPLPTQRPRALKRAATVQDSQVEDVDDWEVEVEVQSGKGNSWTGRESDGGREKQDDGPAEADLELGSAANDEAVETRMNAEGAPSGRSLENLAAEQDHRRGLDIGEQEESEKKTHKEELRVKAEQGTHVVPATDNEDTMTAAREHSLGNAPVSGKEAEEYAAVTACHDEDDEDEEEGSDDEAMYDQATYDPAYSALDRDAARFFAPLTQTQRLRYLSTQLSVYSHDLDLPVFKADQNMSLGDPSVSNEVQTGDEDKDGDEDAAAALQLEEGLTEDGEEAVVPSSLPTERRGVSVVGPRVRDSQACYARAVSPPPHAGDAASERVPSSPPPLRPSQISTVAPSQLSPSRPGSRRSDAGAATETQWGHPQASRRGTTRRWQEREVLHTYQQEQYSVLTLSSSPLPSLPLWSDWESTRSGAEVGFGVGERNKDGGVKGGRDRMEEAMMDFSLPPPPPISSSSVRAWSAHGGPSPGVR